jgi:hypothetical protein
MGTFVDPAFVYYSYQLLLVGDNQKFAVSITSDTYIYIYIYLGIYILPDTRAGRCLGPEGNGVSSREKGEGGPGPPGGEGDKQSTPSEEGGNMEKEEEGRTSQA